MYPYLTYMFINLTFLYYSSISYPQDGNRGQTNYVTVLTFALATLPFWAWQFKQEYRELYGAGLNFLNHFKDWANWLDTVHLFLTPVLIFSNLWKAPMLQSETNDQIAALVAFSVIAKVYDWLKLFDGTAFYILLIEMTLYKIIDFLTPFWIALVMFGMPMVILKPSDADNPN